MRPARRCRHDDAGTTGHDDAATMAASSKEAATMIPRRRWLRRFDAVAFVVAAAAFDTAAFIATRLHPIGRWRQRGWLDATAFVAATFDAATKVAASKATDAAAFSAFETADAAALDEGGVAASKNDATAFDATAFVGRRPSTQCGRPRRRRVTRPRPPMRPRRWPRLPCSHLRRVEGKKTQQSNRCHGDQDGGRGRG